MFKLTQNEFRCPYCRSWINKDLDGAKVCPECGKKLKCKCVICKKSFVKREIGIRQVCYSEECLKTYRHACGTGNRFWRVKCCRWCKKKLGRVKNNYCSEECKKTYYDARKAIRKTFDKKDWDAEYEQLAELGKDYVFVGEETAKK